MGNFLRTMNILDVNNITCGYGGVPIIKDASFSLKEKEFVGIIGPNGTGKTTLFRAISRILCLSNGEILYSGRKNTSISHKDFAKEIAVLPQMLDIPFSFSVREFVTLGRYPHLGRFSAIDDEDRNIVNDAMELTDTLSFADRSISDLSGGERQRVVLAQAFAQKTKLMLLDEPIAHLDIAHQVHTLDLLKKLNLECGLTVVIVLHDLNLASNYCDRLLLFSEGRIFCDGTPNEVLTYQNIEKVFKTRVVVKESPINKRPHVFLAPEF